MARKCFKTIYPSLYKWCCIWRQFHGDTEVHSKQTTSTAAFGTCISFENFIKKDIKVWSYWKVYTECERQEISKGFRFEVLHIAQPEHQRKHGEVAWCLEVIRFHKTLKFWRCITQTCLARLQQFLSALLVSKFHFQLKHWSHMSSSRYSLSYTQSKQWKIITYNDNFLVVKF